MSSPAAADLEGAIAALRERARVDAKNPSVWRRLGDRLTAAGRLAEADEAYNRSVANSVNDPELMSAADALAAGKLAVAEPILRQRLKQAPTDVAAMRMLAELGMRIGRNGDAEKLLSRALELAPGFTPARHAYALVLHRLNRQPEALEQIERLLKDEPGHLPLRNLKASALGRIGEYEQAIALYREVLESQPRQPKVWMSLGHSLKTVGRQEESVAAYRESIALAPSQGEAWWSLANLKRVRFSDEDRAAMRAALQGELSAEDRFHLEFALGKAEEDAGHYAESFAHYAEGNRLRREQVDHDPDELTSHVARSKALFTPAFIGEREGAGCPAPDPIFILGMPRAGSTLVEQILASHPEIEGTMELPDIPSIATRLGERKRRGEETKYPEVLASLGPGELRALGEEYLDRTRVQRKTDRPFFIDKMPNNWMHVGLIRLILPNARIIDARRHPLGCCFSNFKQHFARGQTFTYDLAELGRYYADYVALMAHFDAVQPDAIHRVHYEAMVEETEGEVRRLLDYLGLPFDPACLRFYESDRAVRTASSEQVRQPIFQEGLDQWTHFDPWLEPLKDALGDVLTCYPEVPARLRQLQL